ncbi:FHF complex subunit HOOK-interacting protein 1B-like isoform X1 [Diadema antillarum]|uniref:FHF complex subunit HOOK-interacting protein 1B-like isoform X1 n=1 Tax=Diadema antillarum TaxID=105358 RepID=UPI003A852F4E
MSKLLRRRSNSAMPAVNSPPPSVVAAPERIHLSAEQEAMQVRREVYLNHWKQIQAIINKVLVRTRRWSKVSVDDVQTVVNYAMQMMQLLVEEEAPTQGTIGRLLEITIQENIMEKLLIWSERAGEHQEDTKRELLRIYELMIGQCRQPVLMHTHILNPLLRLLLACWEYSREDAEDQLIHLLQQLCICLSQDPNLLEFLFHASPSKGPAKFLLFSLLIPYIHREGVMGQQARDALLLCISVSAEAKHIGKYIAESTNLCPVLAGGLGALYSHLPRKLDITPDHWHRLTQEDVSRIPDLAMFINSLEFCNAVVQVAHPLISDQLVEFFYKGFLVPVIGPALHQLDREAILLRSNKNRPFPHNDALQGTTDLNLNEEIVSATAYVEIFLRSISDPRLMRVFLRYLCLDYYDNNTILDSLIRRIGTNSKLCVVTLSLFDTLLNVNCEDVMVELILKYLVPCTHVMASQRNAIRDLDFYGRWAEKFLSLSPACSKVHKETSDKTSHKGSKSDLSSRSRNVSDPADSFLNTSDSLGVVRLTSKDQVTLSGSNQSLNNGCVQEGSVPQQNGHGRLTPDPSAASNTSRTSDSDTLSQGSRISSDGSVCDIESSHIEYLLDARGAIMECCKSCKHWSAPYDGLNPAPSMLSPDVERGRDVSLEERFKFRSTSKFSESLQSPGRESLSASTPRDIEGDNNNESPKDRTRSFSRSFESEKDLALAGTLSSTIDEVLQMSIGDDAGRTDDYGDVTLAEIFQGEQLSIAEIVDKMETDKSSREDTESSEDQSQGDSDERGVEGVSKYSFHRRPVLPGADRDVMSDDSRMSSTTHSRQDSLFEFDEPGIFWQFDSDLDITPHRRFSSSGGHFFDDSYETFQSINESSDFQHNSTFSRNGLMDGEFPTSFHTNGTSSVGSPLSFDEVDDNHFTLSDVSSGESSPRHEGGSPRGGASPSGMVERTNSNMSHFGSLRPASISSLGPFSPGGKISAAPTIGPFMAIIFNKLDSMMENSLWVNLLLTGIIARLACYPQPLIRSFLLNANMVFQPSVRSLPQVLTSVKARLDVYAQSVDKWDFLLQRAKQYLTTRESPDANHPLRDRSWSVMEERDKVTVKPRSGTLTSVKQVARRGSLTDMFLKRRNRSVKNSEKQKLTAIREAADSSSQDAVKQQETSAQYESLRSRNAVYCAVVLDEFVKELAALAQEHAVLSAESL